MLSNISNGMASTLANSLFSKLDTQNQGYIEKSGLQSAFSKIADSSESWTITDDIFTRLDGDGDGKVSREEMVTYVQIILDQMKSRSADMRMNGDGHDGPAGTAGMPPPPPPEDDAGFTKEELTTQLAQLGSSDSRRAELISRIIENFDEADSDGDGRVSFEEAMAYDRANQTGTSGSSTSANVVTAPDNKSSEAGMAMQIVRLMQAYHVFEDGSSQSDSTGLFSASA